VVGALLGRDREVDTVGEVVAVVEWGIIIIADVLGKYVLAFFARPAKAVRAGAIIPH
jgi:hypothetical protein